VSEYSDTAQASIVFMGRESFRMEVVGKPALADDTGAVPTAYRETPTERIIERRRTNERRRSPPRALAGQAQPAQGPTPTKNSVIAVSLIFFVGGALVATAVDRLRRYVGSERSARVTERVQPATIATQPVPQPPQAPTVSAIVVQPLPKPEPEAALPPALAPAVTPPAAAEARSEKPPLAAKASGALHGGPAPGLRARRLAPPSPARASEVRPTEPPPVKPTARWVDPFAE
jgi:hypothetical protein